MNLAPCLAVGCLPQSVPPTARGKIHLTLNLNVVIEANQSWVRTDQLGVRGRTYPLATSLGNHERHLLLENFGHITYFRSLLGVLNQANVLIEFYFYGEVRMIDPERMEFVTGIYESEPWVRLQGTEAITTFMNEFERLTQPADFLRSLGDQLTLNRLPIRHVFENLVGLEFNQFKIYRKKLELLKVIIRETPINRGQNSDSGYSTN